MRVATWNVNSLRARLPRLLEFLDQHAPDVICLQETKVDLGGFPQLELDAAGYESVDHSAGRWAGVAIAVRRGWALADVVCGLAGEPETAEARWIEADVGGLRVASVYVPNGRAVGTPTFAAKLQFLEALAARVAALAPGPLIVAGDFNVAPADIDVYDPAAFVEDTHVTPDERGRLERILEAGVVDAYRLVHPGEAGYTWWDYRAGNFHRGLGMRIDLVLVSAALVPGLRSCGIDRSYRKGKKPSDHAPLLAELDGV